MPSDVEKEIAEANARLPVVLPDTPMPLQFQIRSIALAVAQRHCADCTVQEGALYQQLKMDNKLGGALSVNDVLRAALVFERYLWGEWSKGLAANALEATETQISDALEQEFKAFVEQRANEERSGEDDGAPPIRPHAGGADVL